MSTQTAKHELRTDPTYRATHRRGTRRTHTELGDAALAPADHQPEAVAA